MKYLAPLAAAVAALVLTATASPAPTSSKWSAMTLSQREHVVVHSIHRERSHVLWWVKHRSPDPALAGLVSFGPARCPLIGIPAPASVCAAAARARHASVVLGRIRAVIERVRAAEAARLALPAHLSLWRCIERGESGGDGVHPGDPNASNGTHFNVLQMTEPWYGLHPVGLPYSTIETAAESEYAANHYSSSWLEGQWGQTIGSCWGYA